MHGRVALEGIREIAQSLEVRPHSLNWQTARIDGGGDDASVPEKPLQLEGIDSGVVQKIYGEGVAQLMQVEFHAGFRANDRNDPADPVDRKGPSTARALSSLSETQRYGVPYPDARLSFR